MAHEYKEVGDLQLGDLIYVNEQQWVTEPLSTPAGYPLDPDYVDQCPTVIVTKLTVAAKRGQYSFVKINNLDGLYRTDLIVPVPADEQPDRS